MNWYEFCNRFDDYAEANEAALLLWIALAVVVGWFLYMLVTYRLGRKP